MSRWILSYENYTMECDVLTLWICWCAKYSIYGYRKAQNINASCQIQSLYDYHISCIWVKQVSMWATYYNIAGNNFNLVVLLLFVERIGCFLISNFIAKYIISPTRKGRKITEGITLIIGESVTILFIIEKIQIQNILIIIKRVLKPLLYMP